MYPVNEFLTSDRYFLRYTSDNPLVVEDDEEKTGETGASSRATSLESEIGVAHVHLNKFNPTDQPETHGHVAANATIESLDRLTSANGPLPLQRNGRIVRKDAQGAAATGDPLRPLPAHLSPF